MDNTVINNIKSLGIDMIDQAKSGHPGIVLDAAPIIYTLFANHLNINPSDSKWINRDRFIMSAGHGSALLYATLFMSGVELDIEDLKKFRQINSNTPGHPEFGITGVECSTGPLGQGIATSVGMALASKLLNEEYKFNGKSLINYKVYCLVGDGDLMEGISYEAASLAGNLNLNNLIVLYDSNDISLDGNISNTFNENIKQRFKSMGWNYIKVKNGTNLNSINIAITRAKRSTKPVIIEIKTKIGNGSLNENTNIVHGTPLNNDDIIQLKSKLNMPQDKFYVDEKARSYFNGKIANRINLNYINWGKNYREYTNNNQNDKIKLLYSILNYNLFNIDWKISSNLKQSLRDTNSYVMDILSNNIPLFIGGSADTANSTKTYIKSSAAISKNNYIGKNIWFGVREHAMGAILNGLALSNYRPYGSTFLAFSDYMKPAMRMSALMNLPVTYIYTHDSINIGSDGPTHQPIEQIGMIRSIPNMKVYRPSDAKELIGCWQLIINSNSPSALLLGRNEVELLDTTSSINTLKGGYIFKKEQNRLDAIIISTGTDLHVVKNIYYELQNEGYDIRVISMPSIEVFEMQSIEYKNEVLPKVKTIVIEASNDTKWLKYTSFDYLININKFGKSGNKDDVLKYFGFDYESIKGKVKELLK